jgi:pimeloyl-ACP methyl ester carboxylesterase
MQPTTSSVSVLGVALISMTLHANNQTFRPDLTAEVDGLRLNYSKSGPVNDKPTLLMVHGFGASLETWHDIWPLLTQDFQVVRVDLKGSGFSSKPSDGSYSPQTQAGLIRQFARAIGLTRVVLVGHSLGAGITLLAALEEQQHTEPVVQGLVLISAAALPQKTPFFVEAYRNRWLRMAGRILPAQVKARTTLRRIFTVDQQITDDRVERYAHFLSLPNTESALVATAKALANVDAAATALQLGTLSVPTQIIWGDSDPAIPVANGRRLHALILNSQLDILPNTGHVPQEERPDETARLIRRFVLSLR